MKFETKDSGQRVMFNTGMTRDASDNKLRFDLIVPAEQAPDESMFFRWAALLGRGAKKYAARNWEKARTDEELQRFKESAFRHFMQWYTGQQDEDHAAAVFFNITGAEYVKDRMTAPAMMEIFRAISDSVPNADGTHTVWAERVWDQNGVRRVEGLPVPTEIDDAKSDTAGDVGGGRSDVARRPVHGC